MHNIDFLNSVINEEFNKLNLVKSPTELYAPIDYAVKMGGKRIRPLLALLSTEMFGADYVTALNPAIALELFHNFTLIHDDIMDKAPLRRGQDSVYKKWNTDIAILSGDTLFAIAYKYLIKTESKYLEPLLNVFTDTAISVCEGQQLDMNFESDKRIAISDYIEMINLKTGILIAAALKVGAIIADAKPEDINNIYKYGINIGIAFQIKDDLLDSFPSNAKFGKQIGGDIIANKKTFLYLKAHEIAKENNLSNLEYFFNNENIDQEEKVTEILKIYNKLNIKEISEKEINYYYNSALQYFNFIDATAEKKKYLQDFTDIIFTRDY